MDDQTNTAPADGALTGLAYMADLMRRMKAELESQFSMFTQAREQAEKRLSDSALPDAELKACRADLKAAVDALSVIVRTLEKVDEMERRIMRDQAELAALPASEAAYERLIGEVERAIEARVAERLSRIDASRDGQADARPPPDPGDNLPAMEPADVR